MPIISQKGSSGGGSSAFTVVRAPFTFATAGILTGHTIYTPTAGDLIVGWASGISITTAFNGTTPHIDVISQGAVPSSGNFIADQNGGSVNAPLDNGTPDTHIYAIYAMAGSVLTSLFRCQDTTPIQVMLGDNNGGDPGSTTGAGEIILTIIPAT